MIIIKILILIVIINVCYSLYLSDSNVIKITNSNFETEVLKSDNLWLIEFYGKF